MTLPHRVGKYEIVSLIAETGMAAVFLAKTTGIASFERHLVLKVLPERASPQQARMFRDEARLVGMLHHHHVGQVFDFGCSAGRYYLAMEYIHGADLRTVLQRSLAAGAKLSLNFSLTVARSVASALRYVHDLRGPEGDSLDIIHRDISPSNVMVSHDGSVKLIDFGIAKASTQTADTAVGFLKGKAGYMAPEYVRGCAPDRRSDLYALGILLYELTTQRRAFSGNDALRRVIHGELCPPSEVVPGYLHDLERVVLTAVALDPSDRFQTASQLVDAIDELALHHGLQLGPDCVADQLLALYGHRQAPWVASMRDAATSSDDHAARTTLRRIALGTCGDAELGDAARTLPRAASPLTDEPSLVIEIDVDAFEVTTPLAKPVPSLPRPGKRPTPTPARAPSPIGTPGTHRTDAEREVPDLRPARDEPRARTEIADAASATTDRRARTLPVRAEHARRGPAMVAALLVLGVVAGSLSYLVL